MAKAEDVETPNSGRVCGTRQLFPIERTAHGRHQRALRSLTGRPRSAFASYSSSTGVDCHF